MNVISCVCLCNKYFRCLEMRYAKHVHEILASRKIPPSNASFLTYFDINLILCFWCRPSHFRMCFMIQDHFPYITIPEHHEVVLDAKKICSYIKIFEINCMFELRYILVGTSFMNKLL